MPAALVTLEDHIAGDSWQGIPVIGPIIINEAQPGAAAARVRMTLNRTPMTTGARMMFDSDGGDGTYPITIVDAQTWEFTVPGVAYSAFTLPTGNYVGHLEITDVNGERLTTHEIHMEITTDYTP